MKAALLILLFAAPGGARAGELVDKSDPKWAAPRAPVGFRTAGGVTIRDVTGANTYIEIALDDDGKFTIGTAAGDPDRSSDDGKKLVFGHSSPSTSDTMLRVDAGTPASIHTSSNTATFDGTSARVVLAAGAVEITETLRIVDGRGTRNKDTVEISFTLKNVDSVAHTVGLRTQIDTQLGDNDGAPFRVPGVGEVTKDAEYDRLASTPGVPDMPPNVIVFDSLESPTVIGLLSFAPVDGRPVDRLVLGYWPTSTGTFDYTVDPNRSFLDNNGDGTISGSSPDSDSSVIAYWGYPQASQVTILPNATTTFTLLYGIGDYDFKSQQPVNVGVFSASELTGTASGGTYEYATVPVSVFIKNIGASAFTNATATLRFRPDAYAFASGETATKTIELSTGTGTLGIGETAQLDWRLTTGARFLGEQPLKVDIEAAGALVSAIRNIFIATIPNAVYGTVTDENGTPLAGRSVEVRGGSGVVGTATTQSDGRYAVTGLAPGPYTVRVSGGGLPDSTFEALVSGGKDGGQTTNPGMFQAGTRLQTFSYPNPARTGRARIVYFADGARSAKIEIYNTAGERITTLDADAAGAGWREVEWSIEDVANGVYLYRVESGSAEGFGKIAVLKYKGR